MEVVVKTIVDNYVYEEGFQSSWGLSLYIEYLGKAIIFDVDSSYSVWRHNAELLGIDPSKVEAIVISHWHGDHSGPLREVLRWIGRTVHVYVPSKPFLARFYGLRETIVCSEPCSIYDNVFTTGSLGGFISEQALVINRSSDLLVFVGCSHPGVDRIVEYAKEITGVEKVKFVMGGFHISSLEDGFYIARRLKDLGVEYVSPMHCTGSGAREAIKRLFGDKYVENGSGKVIVF